MPIIYTVITGNCDDLKEPLVITPGWEYVCYTDKPKKSGVWEVIMLKNGPPRDLAKRVKIAHQFKHSIYIDASFYINCDLNQFLDKHYVEGKLCTMQHPKHNDPYTELDNVLNTGRDTLDNCNRIRSIFQQEGILPNSGMVASGIILRDGGTEEFCEAWYNTYLTTGPRDQLAWARVNKQMPGVTHLFDYDYTKETDFLHVPHLDKPGKRRDRLAHYKRLKLI